MVTEGGEVLVQGLRAGVLEGFRFVPDRAVREGSKGLLAAANRALRSGIRERVAALGRGRGRRVRACGRSAEIDWRGTAVARLVAGESVLAPQVEVLPSELLDRRCASRSGAGSPRGSTHSSAPTSARCSRRGRPRSPAPRAASCSCSRKASAPFLAGAWRRSSRPSPRTTGAPSTASGVTLGRLTVFLPALLRPEALRLRARLFAIRHANAPGAGGAWRGPDGGPGRHPVRAARPGAVVRVLRGLRLRGGRAPRGAGGPPRPRGHRRLPPLARAGRSCSRPSSPPILGCPSARCPRSWPPSATSSARAASRGGEAASVAAPEPGALSRRFLPGVETDGIAAPGRRPSCTRPGEPPPPRAVEERSRSARRRRGAWRRPGSRGARGRRRR